MLLFTDRTLLLSSVPSTTRCCFCFGSIPSFFLEWFLQQSPVAYCASTDLRSSSFSVVSFCLFILSWGSQGKNTEVLPYAFQFRRDTQQIPDKQGWGFIAYLGDYNSPHLPLWQSAAKFRMLEVGRRRTAVGQVTALVSGCVFWWWICSQIFSLESQFLCAPVFSFVKQDKYSIQQVLAAF